MARKKESAKAKPAEHNLEGLEQVRALSHPLRLRLMEMFAACPRTTKQAALELGESPTRLYHHVAALEKAGLIRLRETRRNRGTTEKYFEVVSNRLVGGPEAAAPGRKEARRTQAAMGFVLFDQARKELVQALAVNPESSPDALIAVRGVMRLSRKAARQVQKELLDLLGRLQKSAASERNASSRTKLTRYSLTIALLPTDEGGGEP
jgi:DNA-binding transcriptional ArsR family regulator